MDKKEKLMSKIIDKAVEGGFDKQNAEDFRAILRVMRVKPASRDCFIISFIFSSNFAKAYWGEGDITYKEGRWKHCQHVMLDRVQEGMNPLEYLKEFLT